MLLYTVTLLCWDRLRSIEYNHNLSHKIDYHRVKLARGRCWKYRKINMSQSVQEYCCCLRIQPSIPRQFVRVNSHLKHGWATTTYSSLMKISIYFLAWYESNLICWWKMKLFFPHLDRRSICRSFRVVENSTIYQMRISIQKKV